MTNKVTLETEFVVPDDMDKENVRHVLSQFFGDLMRTDRFVDARIVEDNSMDEAEEERLLEMLDGIDESDLEKLDTFITEHTKE